MKLTNIIERKVFFYRMNINEDDISTGKNFNLDLLQSVLGPLRFDTKDRYLSCGNSKSICLWDESLDGQIKIKIGDIRHAGLPNIEQKGEISPLEMSDDQSLCEITHVVFFDNNIVGAEFNFYGARISQLSNYFKKKCPTLAKIKFFPLLNKDIQNQIDHLKDVSFLQMRMHKDYFHLLEKAEKSLADAFTAISDSVDAPVLDVILRQTPRSKKSLGQKVLNFLKNFVGGSSVQTILESMDTFKVKGVNDITNKIENFDFLKDKFISKRKVIKLEKRNRGVVSSSMFNEICDAYDELKDSLEKSASIIFDENN